MRAAVGVGLVGSASIVVVVGEAVLAAASWGPGSVVDSWEPVVGLVDAVPVALGWLLVVRRPTTPVAPALAWTGAATSGVRALEVWGLSASSETPWWGSEAAAFIGPGVWPWQLLGFLALVLVFPTGRLPGWGWLLVAGAGPVAALSINLALAGSAPGSEPSGWRVPLVYAGLALLLATLLAAVGGLVLRFHGGDERQRLQLRWLLLAAGSVPVLLAASWVLVEAGMPGPVAYSGFLLGMLILVPAAVTAAILRHDLFDIERLLGDSVTLLLTTLISAGIYAVTVVALTGILGGVSAGQDLGVAGAAFVTAFCLLPLYHRLHALVGRVTDRQRTVMLAAVRAFVEQVRKGNAEPEQVQEALRGALEDPDMVVLLSVPGRQGHVDMEGRPTSIPVDDAQVALRSAGADIGILVLGRGSARHRRRAVEAALAARLPIEVSRLRLGLRTALDEVTESRSRLLLAVTDERRRLERDLHDGAQQQVVAIGMRLQAMQRALPDHDPGRDELELAVRQLGDTVGELRRIAHGIRPSRLDDGLGAALQGLALDSSVPLDLSVVDLSPNDLTEAMATALYFVVAEAVANACKHARAQRIRVNVGRSDGQLQVRVEDDGIGGVDPLQSLTSLRDRVASVGGTLDVVSPHGGGTSITARI